MATEGATKSADQLNVKIASAIGTSVNWGQAI
jgi:hypothetical protein